MSAQLISSISQQLTGIQSEVNGLRDEANNRIGPREVARSFINKHLNEMPQVVTGVHLVSYEDDRGEHQVKEQYKNLSLWCVALQTTIETGHTSYALLGSIYTQWAEDSFSVKWTPEVAHRVAKLYVNAMQSFGVLDKKLSKIEYVDPETKENKLSTVVKLDESFKEMMNKEVETMREESQMICKPLRNQPEDWSDAVTGIGEHANIPLVTNKTTSGNTMAAPVLSAVNKLQAVKFIVSPHIIEAAYDILDNQHEYNSTEEELRMYREMIQLDTVEVHFGITMDSRGRMYYRGGLLTPQGTDFCKAAFQFAEYKELGATGLKALYLHTANVFGQDKISIEDRISWVENNRNELGLLDDHHDVSENYPSADVFQATVAVLELQRFWASDENESFKSNLVCHQDGTCNGLQHMAAITKNRQTAVTVNCVESTFSDVPSDIYGIIADFAGKNTTGAVSALIEQYGRNMAKNPVMITGYGAGKDTIIKNTAGYLVEKHEDATLAADIGEAYVAAIEANAGAVKAFTDALKARIEIAVKNGATRFQWTTADGFIASTEYRDIECNRIRAGVFNALVRNMFPSPLDEVKTVGAMAPNFIHSIDATHLRMVVNDCDHDLVTVHDSIGSHACNYFKTAESIRTTFVAVHEYPALENLCDNMGMRTPKFRGDYSPNEALKSAYIFS